MFASLGPEKVQSHPRLMLSQKVACSFIALYERLIAPHHPHFVYK